MDRRITLSKQSSAALDSDWQWEVIGEVLFGDGPQPEKDSKGISHWCQTKICTEIIDRMHHYCSEQTWVISVWLLAHLFCYSGEYLPQHIILLFPPLQSDLDSPASPFSYLTSQPASLPASAGNAVGSTTLINIIF